MYSIPIVPRHIWSTYTAKEIVSGNTDDTKKTVGTGPFKYGAGKGLPDPPVEPPGRMVGDVPSASRC